MTQRPRLLPSWDLIISACNLHGCYKKKIKKRQQNNNKHRHGSSYLYLHKNHPNLLQWSELPWGPNFNAQSGLPRPSYWSISVALYPSTLLQVSQNYASQLSTSLTEIGMSPGHQITVLIPECRAWWGCPLNAPWPPNLEAHMLP